MFVVVFTLLLAYHNEDHKRQQRLLFCLFLHFGASRMLHQGLVSSHCPALDATARPARGKEVMRIRLSVSSATIANTAPITC